jgi:hypothetical protein
MSALESSFEDECNKMMNMEMPEFETSESFDKKMEKLISRQKKPYFKMVCTAGRRAACIITILLVLSASSMSVKAVREKAKRIFNSVISSSDDLSGATICNDHKTIELRYTLSALPDDFKAVNYESNTENSYFSYYYYSDSRNQEIYFEQYTYNAYTVLVEGDFTPDEYITAENSQVYQVKLEPDTVENRNVYTVVWTNGEYFFKASGNLDKEELLELCSSTEIAKGKELFVQK